MSGRFLLHRDVNMKICVPSYGAIFLAYESGGGDEYPSNFIYILILGVIAGSALVVMIFIFIGRIKNHKKVKKRNYSLPKPSEYIFRELKPPNSSKNRQYRQYNSRLNNREWHN